jgi:hypothetical protein
MRKVPPKYRDDSATALATPQSSVSTDSTQTLQGIFPNINKSENNTVLIILQSHIHLVNKVATALLVLCHRNHNGLVCLHLIAVDYI